VLYTDQAGSQAAGARRIVRRILFFFGSEKRVPLASCKMTDGDQQLANCSKVRVQLFKVETVRRLLQIVELRILYLSRLCGWNFRNRTDSVEGLA
jgi:hypothetical protein